MDKQGDSFTPGTDGALADGLVKLGRFLNPGPSPRICARSSSKAGGRLTPSTVTAGRTTRKYAPLTA